MKQKTFVSSILLFLLIATIMGCRSNGQDEESSSRQKVLLDSAGQFIKSLEISNQPEDRKLLELRKFYLGFPKRQRSYIYDPVFKKLFFGAYANPDTAILNFFRFQSSDSQNPDRVRIDANFKRAGYYLYLQQQPDSGLAALAETIRFQNIFNDTLYKSYYTLKGQALMQKGDLPNAAANYLKAIETVERMGDSTAIIGNIGNLANVYAEMGDEHKALPLKLQALSYFENNRDTANMYIGFVSVAGTYMNLEEKHKAFAYYQKALKLLKTGVENASITFILYNNLGEIYTQQGDFQTARHYFDLNIPILEKLHSPAQDQLFTVFSIGAYAPIKDVTKETEAIEGYIEGYLKANNLNDARRSLMGLYYVYKAKGNDHIALKYYLRYDSVDKVITGQANNRDITELRTKYDSKRNELRVETQQKELAKKDSFNHLLILLMMLLIFLVFYLNSRNASKRKKKEFHLQQQFTQQLIQRTEEERGRIARDLHDGLSQNLLLLRNRLEEAKPSHIDAMIDEVRSISRNIHPSILDQIGLKNAVFSICTQVMDKEKIFITSSVNYSGSLSAQGELQLYRIIQEALNNIIKYAFAQAVRIEIKETPTSVIVDIIDNGSGFDVAEALNSATAFGLLSIMERSKALQGRASIESSAQGTLVHIEIPRQFHSKENAAKGNTTEAT